MFNYHPIIKIFIVFLLCCQIAYYNYLMFNAENFSAAIVASSILKVGVVFFFLVVLFFVDYYWQKKLYIILACWILFVLLLSINSAGFITGHSPPLYLQYTQSATLLVFSVLLIFTKNKFPNWLRIFSLANLLALIPCLYLYFAEQWYYYEILVYVISFTPVLKSLVFIDERIIQKTEVLDED